MARDPVGVRNLRSFRIHIRIRVRIGIVLYICGFTRKGVLVSTIKGSEDPRAQGAGAGATDL